MRLAVRGDPKGAYIYIYIYIYIYKYINIYIYIIYIALHALCLAGSSMG